MSIVARAVIGTALLLSGMYVQETWQWIGIPLGLILIASASAKEEERGASYDRGVALTNEAEVKQYGEEVVAHQRDLETGSEPVALTNEAEVKQYGEEAVAYHSEVDEYIFKEELEAEQGFLGPRPTIEESAAALREGIPSKVYASRFREESWAEHRAAVKRLREETGEQQSVEDA